MTIASETKEEEGEEEREEEEEAKIAPKAIFA